MTSSWKNAHWQELKKLAGCWIAYEQEGEIIASEKKLSDLILKIEALELDFRPTYYFVHPAHVSEVMPARFYAIYFKAVRQNNWRPVKNIDVISGEKTINLEFLVDSGADFSVLGKETGKALGFEQTNGEKIYTGETAGGGQISYLIREVKMNIEQYIIPVTVAWLLEDNYEELLLGRENVFDSFDIEFKQTDETIIFKWRAENNETV